MFAIGEEVATRLCRSPKGGALQITEEQNVLIS